MHLEAHELHGKHKLFTRDAVVVPLAEVGDKPLGVREEALPKLPDLLRRSSVRARFGLARAKQERRAPHLRRQQRARGPERRARGLVLGQGLRAPRKISSVDTMFGLFLVPSLIMCLLA